jgi:hypothetical protein
MFLIRRGEFAVKEQADSLFYKKVPMVIIIENDPLTAPKLKSLNSKLQMVPANSLGKQTHSALFTSTMYIILGFKYVCFYFLLLFLGLIGRFRQPALKMLEVAQVILFF